MEFVGPLANVLIGYFNTCLILHIVPSFLVKYKFDLIHNLFIHNLKFLIVFFINLFKLPFNIHAFSPSIKPNPDISLLNVICILFSLIIIYLIPNLFFNNSQNLIS